MSELLRSGRVGNIDKYRNSNDNIYNSWKASGLLDGLDRSVCFKMAIALELTANIILMEEMSCDIMCDIDGRVFKENERFSTVIFPIVRRILSKTPEALEYIPEIINMSKKHYNTPLSRAVHDGNENYLEHFYNKVLPKWCEHHAEREHKDYDSFKKAIYEKHVQVSNDLGQTPEPFSIFKCIDWEAEFCAALAEKIETEIKEHINKLENETN
jgi:hypothetical protein